MKKRRKGDDDSCLVQFVKTILLLACVISVPLKLGPVKY